jgi:hypothetical protein
MLVLLELIYGLKRVNGTPAGMGLVSWAKDKIRVCLIKIVYSRGKV